MTNRYICVIIISIRYQVRIIVNRFLLLEVPRELITISSLTFRKTRRPPPGGDGGIPPGGKFMKNPAAGYVFTKYSKKKAPAGRLKVLFTDNIWHWDQISKFESLFFHCFATKCYFCFVNPWFRCGSAPFYLYIPVLVPKHDLKHPKSDIFGFTGGAFMDLECVFNDSEMLFNDFEIFCLWFWKAV